ncbi:hypothetical protein J4441_04580 [Candidatus Micrarchaeota archaeon]|nr:hypothetical protein [Candidatus Micrarchaeota archaeon]
MKNGHIIELNPIFCKPSATLKASLQTTEVSSGDFLPEIPNIYKPHQIYQEQIYQEQIRNLEERVNCLEQRIKSKEPLQDFKNAHPPLREPTSDEVESVESYLAEKNSADLSQIQDDLNLELDIIVSILDKLAKENKIRLRD